MKSNLAMRLVVCPKCGRKLRVLNTATKIPQHTRRDNASLQCDGAGANIVEK